MLFLLAAMLQLVNFTALLYKNFLKVLNNVLFSRAFSDTSLNFVCINIGDITSTGNLNYFPLPKLVGDKDNKLQELEEHFYAFQIARELPWFSCQFLQQVRCGYLISPLLV